MRTCLVARLLGVRLLTVEGTVSLTPAAFDAVQDHGVWRAVSAVEANASVQHGPWPRRRELVGDPSSGAIGARLGDTVRLIDQAITDLSALDRAG